MIIKPTELIVSLTQSGETTDTEYYLVMKGLELYKLLSLMFQLANQLD